jgi:hypothetical protein
MRQRTTYVVLGLALAAGLGAVAGTIWVGSKVREEPVVANPYEEGLRQDADRDARARLRWNVRIESAPVAGGAGTFTFAVLDGNGEPLEGAEVEVAVGPTDSSRGIVRARVATIGPGRYAADSGVTGRGAWLATFDVSRGVDRMRIERTLESGGPCDLAEGPCTLRFEGGEGLPAGSVALELGPRPLRTMRELAAVATVSAGGVPLDGAAVKVSLGMPGMSMGENVAALAADAAGRYVGRLTVVRCLSGRRDWVAEVTVARAGGATAVLRFPFTVVE